jgi:hypothetical protein
MILAIRAVRQMVRTDDVGFHLVFLDTNYSFVVNS